MTTTTLALFALAACSTPPPAELEPEALAPASAQADLKGTPPGMDADDPTIATPEEEQEGRVIATLMSTDGEAMGTLTVVPVNRGVTLRGRIEGLAPNSLHALHVHEGKECGDGAAGFAAAEGHFAPEGEPHGTPGELKHHAGDLGNVQANGEGVAVVYARAPELTEEGTRGILGRTIVLHGEADAGTLDSAGPRMACGAFVDRGDS